MYYILMPSNLRSFCLLVNKLSNAILYSTDLRQKLLIFFFFNFLYFQSFVLVVFFCVSKIPPISTPLLVTLTESEIKQLQQRECSIMIL